MSFLATDWRNRRNLLFGSQHYPSANYYTDIRYKTDMKSSFEEEYFLNNLHLIPDPLKKNLADTLVMNQNTNKEKMEEFKNHHEPPIVDDQSNIHNESPLSGITNFFAGMFNVLTGVMFRRPKSPDNFEEALPSGWQNSKNDYKNGSEGPDMPNKVSDMTDYKTAISNCENKLSELQEILSGKNSQSKPKVRNRRPKRVFVESSSVEDCFEDAFSPEDFVRVANDAYIEYYTPLQYQEEEYFEVDSPKIRLEFEPSVSPNLDDIKTLPLVEEKHEVTKQAESFPPQTDTELTNNELVTTCEDKLLKLKALLQERRCKAKVAQDTDISKVETKQAKPIPISKSKDKRFKNPNRTHHKKSKMNLKHSIQEDLLFANEVNLEDPSSVESSVSFGNSLEKSNSLPDEPEEEYFDEISGRFRRNSETSEDSFQIVVTDVPRLRRISDCDSEDSFIVFEDSPDSCYTSNDVFCDSDSDSDSDVSDSGCFKLDQSLTRTVCNLADDTLYDEVDYGGVVPSSELCDIKPLLSDHKAEVKKKSTKKVTFSSQPPKVHVMRVWAFAARQARAGHWERYALDRERFKRRIADVEMAVSWVLKPQHRSRVMFQRFMPFRNAEKRRELAEKKLLEEEKLKADAEKRSDQEFNVVSENESCNVFKDENCGVDNKKEINGCDKDNIVPEENDDKNVEIGDDSVEKII